MLTITRVRSPRDVRRFIDFDRELYAENPFYAPPLRYELHQRVQRWIRPAITPKNQAALFLAEQDGPERRLLGRISASIDHARNEREGRRTGAFGFLEAIDDRSVFGALFGAAEEWLVAHGAQRVLGPFSFVQEDPYVGLLVSGFDEPPSFGMTYSPSYYPDHVEALGYARAMDLRSYVVRTEGEPPRALRERAAALRASHDVTVRPIAMRDVWEEARRIRGLFNAALAGGWEYVPLEDEQVRDMVRELRLVVDPRLVLFAELDGDPVGCVVGLPDINDVLRACEGRLFPLGLVRLLLARRRRARLRGYALAVLPRFRRMGVASLLVCESFRRAAAAGYEEAELSWVPAAAAPMLALADRFAHPTTKVHRVYAKDLAD